METPTGPEADVFKDKNLSHSKRLKAPALISFGLLSTPIALASVVVLTFVPTFYAIDLGLGLGGIGMIFAVGRIMDVVTDPVIGHLSDQSSTRFGRRIPWIVIGGLLFVILTAAIFVPQVDQSLMSTFIVVSLFFLTLTLVDLPYSAIGLELSEHAHERTSLAAVKATFQVLGALIGAGLMAHYANNPASGYQLLTLIVLVMTGVSIPLLVFGVPRRSGERTNRLSAWIALKRIGSNLRYRRLMMAFAFTQTGSALVVGLTALFVLRQVGTPDLTGVYIGLVLLSSAITLPFWLWVSRRFGKRRSWSVGLLVGAVLLLMAPLFDGQGAIPYSIFCVLFGAVVAGDVILPTSLLADQAFDEGGHDDNSAGLMLGFKNAVSKLGFVAPMGLAFPVLGAMGIATTDKMGPLQSFALLTFYAFIPAVLRLIAYMSLMYGRSEDRTPNLLISDHSE